MTPQLWLAIATFVLAGPITFVGFMLKRVYSAGQEAEKLEHRLQTIQSNVSSLMNRMDVAGKEISDLATDVQGLGERTRRELMKEFQSLDVSQERWQENARAHAEFAGRIDKLWNEVALPSRRAGDRHDA